MPVRLLLIVPILTILVLSRSASAFGGATMGAPAAVPCQVWSIKLHAITEALVVATPGGTYDGDEQGDVRAGTLLPDGWEPIGLMPLTEGAGGGMFHSRYKQSWNVVLRKCVDGEIEAARAAEYVLTSMQAGQPIPASDPTFRIEIDRLDASADSASPGDHVWVRVSVTMEGQTAGLVGQVRPLAMAAAQAALPAPGVPPAEGGTTP